jgi:UDP-3-O-[3-hydroxymyristoyl] glucosamine N-acyltransferase
MLHIGKVVIEDNVEIFPYTNVDKATLSETRICKGSKIDHYCHIWHNTYVGENVIITAQVVLAGGAKILNKAFLGVNTKVKDSCIVGENSITGMGSVVVCNIPSNEVWAGIPAKFLKRN